MITPGPWTLTRLDNQAQVDAPTHTGLAIVWVRLDGDQFDDPTMVANARAIAAVPMLIEALSACLARIESDIETNSLRTGEGNLARAALARIGR